MRPQHSWAWAWGCSSWFNNSWIAESARRPPKLPGPRGHLLNKEEQNKRTTVVLLSRSFIFRFIFLEIYGRRSEVPRFIIISRSFLSSSLTRPPQCPRSRRVAACLSPALEESKSERLNEGVRTKESFSAIFRVFWSFGTLSAILEPHPLYTCRNLVIDSQKASTRV